MAIIISASEARSLVTTAVQKIASEQAAINQAVSQAISSIRPTLSTEDTEITISVDDARRYTSVNLKGKEQEAVLTFKIKSIVTTSGNPSLKFIETVNNNPLGGVYGGVLIVLTADNNFIGSSKIISESITTISKAIRITSKNRNRFLDVFFDPTISSALRSYFEVQGFTVASANSVNDINLLLSSTSGSQQLQSNLVNTRISW